MRSSLAAAAALLAVAQAIISGIAAPETIKPGDTIDITLMATNYIQSVYDVAVAIGYDTGVGHADSLGTVAGSFCLGPSESNQAHNITKSVTIPETAPKGQGIITASVMSLFGVANWPALDNWNVTVTFGSRTSENYVSSKQ